MAIFTKSSETGSVAFDVTAQDVLDSKNRRLQYPAI
jgi:hypothetical protein